MVGVIFDMTKSKTDSAGGGRAGRHMVVSKSAKMFKGKNFNGAVVLKSHWVAEANPSP